MARRVRSSRRGKRQSKENDDFVRLTGLWRPDNRDSKALGQGAVKLEDLQDLVERIEDKGGDAAFIYMFKNEYAESSRDPRYVLSALPLGERDDDEDERPRRGKKKRSRWDEEEEEPRRRTKKKRSRRDEEEDDEDDVDDDEDDDEDPPF